MRHHLLVALGQDEIGRRIAEARDGAEPRLTQRDLADQLGVDPVTVSRWERGQNPVAIRWLRKISDITGRQIGFFVQDGGGEDPPPFERIGVTPMVPYLEETVTRIFALGPAEVAEHREMLETMLGSLREQAKETLAFVDRMEALLEGGASASSSESPHG